MPVRRAGLRAGLQATASRYRTAGTERSRRGQLFQFRAVRPARVIHCPTTSSTTTICGSFCAFLRAQSPAAQTAGSEKRSREDSEAPGRPTDREGKDQRRSEWRRRIRRCPGPLGNNRNRTTWRGDPASLSLIDHSSSISSGRARGSRSRTSPRPNFPDRSDGNGRCKRACWGRPWTPASCRWGTSRFYFSPRMIVTG